MSKISTKDLKKGDHIQVIEGEWRGNDGVVIGDERQRGNVYFVPVKLENGDKLEISRGYLKKAGDVAPEEDVIKTDVPLFIRLLEFAREDASGDLDLHDVAKAAIGFGDKILTMKDYEALVPKQPPKKSSELRRLAKELKKIKTASDAVSVYWEFYDKEKDEYEEERELAVEFDYTAGCPGRYSGPPEKCYPEEPEELEIIGITDAKTGEDLYKRFSKKDLQEIEEKALQKLKEMGFDADVD